MLKLLILSILAVSVQSAWWWPWPRKKDSSNVPFVYYNDSVGVETVITKNFVQELNPTAYSLLKLIITGIKLPIAPQKLGKGRLITVNFEDATCHQLKIIRDEEAPGLYLGDGFIGLGIKFDVKCRAWFKLPRLGMIITVIVRFMHGWANITFTGVQGNAHIALNYDNHDQNIQPEIIAPFDLTFKDVDIKLDNNHAINGLTTALKIIFPKVASTMFKKSITHTVHSVASKLKTINFGFKKHYHPIFLYPPVVNPERVKLNIGLVEWNTKNDPTNDTEDDETDTNISGNDEGDDQGDSEEDSYSQDDEDEKYHDAMQDLDGLE